MPFRERYARWLLVSSASGLVLLTAAATGLPFTSTAVIVWSLVSFLFLLRLDGDLSRSANWVTTSRVVLAAGALACGFSAAGSPAQILLFSLAIGSDLLDGWLARRGGETHSGAVLDMEADQLLVLLMAVACLHSNPLGALVLLLPGYKYAFALLQQSLRLPLGDPKPVAGDNRRARRIYVLVLAALFSALPGLAPTLPGLSALLLMLALPALGASFAADARYQWLSARPTTP